MTFAKTLASVWPNGAAGRPTLGRVLTRSFTLVASLSVLVALIAVFGTGLLLQRDYTRDNLELLARQAAYSVEVPVVFNDRRGIAESVQPVLESGNVATIIVRDSAGATLVTLTAENTDTLWDWAPALLLPDPVDAPIVSAGSQIGSVHVTSSGEGVAQLIVASILGAIGCITAIALGTMAIARRLNRVLVRPIDAIADVAHAVRDDGQFARRAPSADIAEVDDLAQNFNALLSTLEDWHGQIADTHEALLHRASHDPLSGLPNRASFVERVRDAILTAKRNKDRFAILFMDGDRFKQTNDKFGHAAGDKVIATVAARMRPLLRVGDMAARLGGDEFALLIHHLESVDDAQSVATRMAEAMQEPIAISDYDDVLVSLSVGIAIYPDDGEEVEALLKCADARMYATKDARA